VFSLDNTFFLSRLRRMAATKRIIGTRGISRGGERRAGGDSPDVRPEQRKITANPPNLLWAARVNCHADGRIFFENRANDGK